jgi:hypothetical protein
LQRKDTAEKTSYTKSLIKMEIIKVLLMFLFCLSSSFAQEVIEDRPVDIDGPPTNYVFDLPDIVANYETLGEEVQLEAFGAREVHYLKKKTYFQVSLG